MSPKMTSFNTEKHMLNNVGSCKGKNGEGPHVTKVGSAQRKLGTIRKFNNRMLTLGVGL